MDGGESLERACGRLLRWYPVGHRARHADEMLGVLMADAGSGQRRPGLADAANLIGGALRIRIRAATTGSAGLWRDALARAGIVLPLAWALLTLTLVVPGIAQNVSQLGVQAAGVAAHRLQFLLTSPPYSPRDPAPAGWPPAELSGLGVVTAVTVILLVRSAATRRLLIVLAVPLYCYVAVIVTPVYRLPNPLIYLPLAALGGAAALLAVRWVRTDRRRPAAGGSA